MRDRVMTILGAVAGHGWVPAEQIYVCELFDMSFCKVYIHVHNTYKNLDPFAQTSPNEFKAVHST